MTRFLAAALILCAQVLAAFSTGGLVLCVHENGECAVELAGSRCCSEARVAEERARRSDAAPTSHLIAPETDRCRDVPWKQDDSLAAHGSQVRSAQHHEARAALPALFAWTSPAALDAVRGEYVSPRVPPREAVPRPPRPFVLRC